MRKIVFLSHHVYESPRRAGFHALARSFAEAGWGVSFVTTGISLISLIRRDRRCRLMTAANLLGFARCADGVDSHVHLTPVHPVRLGGVVGRWADRSVFARYGSRLGRRLAARVRDAEVVVFESNASLFLVDAVKREAPAAKLVYRVSDDVAVVGMSEAIVRKERDVVDRMDLISVPSRILLAARFGDRPRARFQPHGIPQRLFEASLDDPFASHDRPQIACVGSTLFDLGFVTTAALARPDCDFHYVGDIPALASIRLPNVHAHGELPFERAVAFAAFADVALANYALPPQGEYLAETSNKLAQYAFFGRVVVMPERIARLTGHANVFGYDPDDPASIAAALARATAAKPIEVDRSGFATWARTRDAILAEIGAS